MKIIHDDDWIYITKQWKFQIGEKHFTRLTQYTNEMVTVLQIANKNMDMPKSLSHLMGLSVMWEELELFRQNQPNLLLTFIMTTEIPHKMI